MYMQGVKGQWNMALNIGGKDFKADPTTVRQCLWFENIHQHLPTLNLELIDVTGDFSTIVAAGDGVPIDITLGDGDKAGENSASFNIMGAPSISHGQGYNLIKLNAVLNNVPFLRKVVTGLYEGPSNQVLQKVAGEVGLQFEGDSTGDAMVWLPNNKTLAGFVRSVANHGWVGAGSCMMLGVTSASKLLYKNVMQPAKSNETFGYLADSHVQIVDWDATSNGLLMNNNRGYGSTSVGYGMDGVLKELNKITFNLFSSFLSISTKNLDSIGPIGGRLDNLIRPAGNTHEKYYDARHQNQRIRSTFSNDLNMLIDQVSYTQLLSEALAIPIDFSKVSPNQSLTGPYILTARTRCLTRSKYCERLVGTSQGQS